MNQVYILVLVIYIGVVVAASLLFRKKRNTQEFWTEGRSVSGFRAGISLSATFMSISWSVVYGVEVFLQNGLGGFFILSLPWLVVLSVFFILAPRLRNIPVFSQPDLIKKNFGGFAGKLAAFPIFFVFIIWGGAELDIAASLLASTTGMNQVFLILVISLVICIYMSLNGTYAVILTDVIQYVLVVTFFLIILFSGWRINEVNTELYTFSASKISLVFIFLTFLAYLPGWLAETDIWIRLQVTENGKEARKAMGIAILNSILFVFVFPLLVASVIQTEITSGLAGVSSLLALIKNPWVAGMAAMGLIAASMSTIDTCSNVAAMTLSYDLAQSKSQLKNVISIWIAGLLSVLFALNSDSLKDAFYLSSALLSTSLFLPIQACFTGFGTRKGVVAVLIAAPPITLFFFLLEKHRWLYLPAGEGVSYILFSMVAVITLFTAITIGGKVR